MEYGKNPILERIVTLEMAGVVERWNLREGCVCILLAIPAHFCCGEPHTWFVNRDGRTRCCDCDEDYVRDKNGTASIGEVARLRGAA